MVLCAVRTYCHGLDNRDPDVNPPRKLLLLASDGKEQHEELLKRIYHLNSDLEDNRYGNSRPLRQGG
jgi:hypothetical protein